MRGLKIGLGVVQGGGLSAAFSVSIGAGPFTTGATLTATVNGLEGGETVTYQWQDDGVNITGATSSTYVAAIGTDGIADASLIRCVVTVNGGDPINSNAREIRYAAGTAPAVADGQSWTVDDTSVNIDGSASGANLTFSYVLSGSTAGVTINSGTGAITGTPTGVDSGTATITATDQYGRELTDTFTWTTALRTQATAANGLGPFAYVIDDSDTISINFVADFTANGNALTYSIAGLPTGGADDGDGTASGTATTQGESGSIVCTATDEYGRQTTSTASFTTAYRTQAVGGADLDLGYPEDSAITPQNLLANWTANGNTLTFVSVSPALPAGLSINSSGVLSGTPTTITADATYTITMQDEYARQTADTFTLEITAVAAAPTIDTIAFVDNNDGTPAQLNLTYTGDVTGYRVYIATGGASISASAAQLYAGSGGTDTLEFADFAVGASVSITGLTATSESAVRISAALIRSADGSDPSNIETVVVSGLDFTSPVFSSAEVGNVNADTVRVTLDSAIYGSSVAGDWTLTGNTISAVTFTPGNSFVDLTLGTTATASDVYTGDLSYSGSSLADADGNTLGTFASQDVTNNVTAVPDVFVDADWSVATGSGASELDVTIATLPNANGSAITDVQYDVDANNTWTSLPSYAGTGTYTITMATASTSYAIRLRAVNGVGNGAAGNSESATSGAAGGTVTRTVAGTETLLTTSATATGTIDVGAGGRVGIIMGGFNFFNDTISSATIGGQTCDVIESYVTSDNCIYFISASGVPASATSALAVTFPGAMNNDLFAQAYVLSGATTFGSLVGDTGSDPYDVSQAVASGDVVIGAAFLSPGPWTTTGLTEDTDASGFVAASAEVATTETRTIQFDQGTTTAGGAAAIRIQP